VLLCVLCCACDLPLGMITRATWEPGPSAGPRAPHQTWCAAHKDWLRRRTALCGPLGIWLGRVAAAAAALAVWSEGRGLKWGKGMEGCCIISLHVVAVGAYLLLRRVVTACTGMTLRFCGRWAAAWNWTGWLWGGGGLASTSCGVDLTAAAGAVHVHDSRTLAVRMILRSYG
jgi:hypothetical protein